MEIHPTLEELRTSQIADEYYNKFKSLPIEDLQNLRKKVLIHGGNFYEKIMDFFDYLRSDRNLQSVAIDRAINNRQKESRLEN
ncbi:MAG: hypothetical protein AABW50_00950 [Nanoarchaeota archaeon]